MIIFKKNFFIQKINKYFKKKSAPFLQDFILIIFLVLVTDFAFQFLIFAPKIVVFGDAARFNGYFAMIIKYSLVHYGQFGLWDQFISSGISWISHPSGLLFSPISWLAIFFFDDPMSAARFMELIYISLASVAFYTLLRVLNISRLTSAIVSIPYIANQYSFLLGVNGWFEEFMGIMLIPATILFVWLGITKRSYFYMLIGSLVMSLHFFDNSYYVFHYNSIAILWIMIIFGLKILWENKKDKMSTLAGKVLSYIILNVVFWVGVICVSAVKLIPLLEFRALSSRNFISLAEAEKEITSFQTLWHRLLNFFITPGHTTAFSQWANTLGLILLLISFIYFLKKRSLLYGTFLSLLLIGIWGVLANNLPFDLYAFMYNFLPGFSSNRYPFRFFIIIQFAFVVCVALGLDILIKQKKIFFIKLLGLIFGVILAISCIEFMLNSFTSASLATNPDLQEAIRKSNNFIVKKDRTYKSPPILSGTIPNDMLAALSKIMSEYKPEGRMHSTFYSNSSPFVTSNMQLLLGEIPSVQHSYAEVMPSYEYGVIFPESTTDSLELTEKRFKMYSILNTRFQFQQKENFEYKGCPKLSLSQTNEASDGKIEKLSNQICNYLEARLTPILTTKVGGIYYDGNVLNKIAIIPQGVLLVTDNRFNDYSGFIAKKLMLHPDFDEHKISILSGGSAYLDDYPIDALKQFNILILVNPKVKNIDKVDSLKKEYETSGGKIINLDSHWINYEGLHQRSSSLWTEKPAWNYSDKDSNLLSSVFTSLNNKSEKSTVKIKKFTPEDVVLYIKTKTNNEVVQYSDSFYPGWKATIDGIRNPVYMADGLVKAVVIKNQGTHTVRFYYSPDSFKKGAAITLITLITLLLIGLYRGRRKITSYVLLILSIINNIGNYIFNSSYRAKKNKDVQKNFNDYVRNILFLIDNNLKFLPGVLIAFFLLYIYGPVILNNVTSAGDLPYYFSGYIKSLALPTLWNPHWPTGLGGNQSIILPLKLYIQLPMLLFTGLGLPWELVQKVFLILAFILLSIGSGYYFTKSAIGSLIYCTNTWILLVFSGGQIGVALAYAVAPLVLKIGIDCLKFLNFSNSLTAGLALSVLYLFDQRIGLLISVVLTLYVLLVMLFDSFKNYRSFIFTIMIPHAVLLPLHAFWILPLIFSGKEANYISEAAPKVTDATFFSFATLSNSLSLLHPNWPDNVFGKVGFMKPEFLVLPIIAYAFLLLRNSKSEARNTKLLFFSFLGLLGAFLAKGVNEPFGAIFLWLFQTIPGFNLFRDPTKFYVLISISYALIIPVVIGLLSQSITSRVNNIFKRDIKRSYITVLLSLIFIAYWIFTLRPFFAGQMGGLFKEHPIPNEYIQLEQFLGKDPEFSRTLWIPSRQRFGYFSDTHPSIDASDLYKTTNPKDIISYLKKPGSIEELENMSIKYIILPSDPEGEIFLTDRRYDEEKYQTIVKNLYALNIFSNKQKFGKIVIGELPHARNHFSIIRNGEYVEGVIDYDKINNERYILNLRNIQEGDILIFSEKYDPGWTVRLPTSKQGATPFHERLNSFLISEGGNYVVEVYYRPEKFLVIGYFISAISFLGTGVFLVFIKKS